MKTKLSAVALAAVLMGCGGVKKDELALEWVKAYCSWLVKCGGAVAQNSCEDYINKRLGLGRALEVRYDKAIAAGKIKFDEGRARGCLNALKDATCDGGDDQVEHSEDCERMYEGQVEDGAACNPGECKPDSYCSFGASFACGAGLCKPRVAEGQPATDPYECKRGLTLVNNKCAKRSSEGGPCFSNTIAGQTTGGWECESTLFCDQGSKTCKKLKKEGEACNQNEPCGGLLSCVNAVCTKPGSAGATCASGSFVSAGGCKLELFCDAASNASGTCKELLAENATCRNMLECKPELVCTGAPGSLACKKPAADGEACETAPDYAQCDYAVSYCDRPTTGARTCVKRKTEGQVCTSSGDCDFGYNCESPAAGGDKVCTSNAC